MIIEIVGFHLIKYYRVIHATFFACGISLSLYVMFFFGIEIIKLVDSS